MSDTHPYKSGQLMTDTKQLFFWQIWIFYLGNNGTVVLLEHMYLTTLTLT